MAKRRGHGEGSVRHRSDGRWEARISLPDGKRKYLYRATQKEARTALRGALRDLDSGLDIGAPTQTVAAFLSSWLEETAKPTIRPKTYASYKQVIRLYVAPSLGSIVLDKLNPAHVQRMMATMTARGLKPRTVGYARSVLRLALGCAVKWSILNRNVATLVKPPRQVKTRPQPLSAAEAHALIDHARSADDRLWPLLTTAVLTGLRIGELSGLRWRDVDLDTATLTVRHTLHRLQGIWTFSEPKTTRSARTLSLPPDVVDALRFVRARQTVERLASGDRWLDLDLVFNTSKGTPIEPSNVNGRLHKLLDDVGLPRQGMHALRHCCASLLAAQGEDLRTIMEQSGHSQISLTADLYVHLTPSIMASAAASLDRAFNEDG